MLFRSVVCAYRSSFFHRIHAPLSHKVVSASIGAPILPSLVAQQLAGLSVKRSSGAVGGHKVAHEARDYIATVSADFSQLEPRTAIDLLRMLNEFNVPSDQPFAIAVNTWVSQNIDSFTPEDVIEICRQCDSVDDFDYWHRHFFSRHGVASLISRLNEKDLVHVAQVVASHAKRQQPIVITLFELIEKRFDSLGPVQFAQVLQTFGHNQGFRPRVTQFCMDYILRVEDVNSFVIIIMQIANAGLLSDEMVSVITDRFLALKPKWTSSFVGEAVHAFRVFPDGPNERILGAVSDFVSKNLQAISALECIQLLDAVALVYESKSSYQGLVEKLVERASIAASTLKEKTLLIKVLGFLPGKADSAIKLSDVVMPEISLCSYTDLSNLLQCHVKLNKFPSEQNLNNIAAHIIGGKAAGKATIDDIAVFVYALAFGGHNRPETFQVLSTKVMTMLKFGKMSDAAVTDIPPHSVAMLLRGFQQGNFAFAKDSRLYTHLAQRAVALRARFGVRECCRLLAVTKSHGAAGESLHKALISQIRASIATMPPNDLLFITHKCVDYRVRDIQLFANIADRLRACADSVPKDIAWQIFRKFEEHQVLASFPKNGLLEILATHEKSLSADEAASALFWLNEVESSSNDMMPFQAKAVHTTSSKGLCEVAVALQSTKYANEMAAKIKGFPPELVLEEIGASKLCRASVCITEKNLMGTVAETLNLGRNSLDPTAMCALLNATAEHGTGTPGLFRAFGKRIADSAKTLSAVDVTKALRGYAASKVQDDYAVRSLFLRAHDLRSSIQKNEEMKRTFEEAKQVFHQWAAAADGRKKIKK